MKDISTFKVFDVPDINLNVTANNLKKLRTDNHLSIKDLQTFFGFVFPNAIYDWERGTKVPSISNLIALSALYEVSINKILLPMEQNFLLLFYYIKTFYLLFKVSL